MTAHSALQALKNTFIRPSVSDSMQGGESYDVTILFLSAEGLPKLDAIGYCDPYFIANIDDKISYTSSIIPNTGTPKWNDERWIVKNVPVNAKLSVTLYDKDDEKPIDDYIGQFKIRDLINYIEPAKGELIVGPLGIHHGRFHLCIEANECSDESKQLPQYTFDGPCRYFRHNSQAMGRLTMLNTECIYSTWKIRVRRIDCFFPSDRQQHWNKQYDSAKAIFGKHPLGAASQTAIRLAHKALYGKTLKNSENGQLNNADDLWNFVFRDRCTKQVKPCIYTYVIDNHMWRFSETGHQFFTDFASKHALLANGSEYVRCAGEFHPRPIDGWNHLDGEWELVFDNGSGTYAPSVDLLNDLKALMQFNFPALRITTYDYKDPELKRSLEDVKHAFEKYKSSTQVIQELVDKNLSTN